MVAELCRLILLHGIYEVNRLERENRYNTAFSGVTRHKKE